MVPKICIGITLMVTTLGVFASPSTDSSVVVLGDSLVVSIRDQISAEMPNVLINARPARTVRKSILTDNGFDWLPIIGLTRRSRWVIELGTNDAWTETMPLESIKRDISLFAQRLEHIGAVDACVSWVTPYMASPVSSSIRARGRAVAGYIRAETAQRSCWRTIEWPTVASKNPQYIGNDGVHLTQAGRRAFTQIILGGARKPGNQPAAK